MSKVFLYRVKDNSDRDCCAYIENNPMRFECGHYFGSPNLQGSCYCGGDFANYDEIKTVLTESEYQAFIQFSKAIAQLGYGITKDDERYLEGVRLCKEIQTVYDKLNGDEAREFYNGIIADEKEFVMDEFSLSENQVETVFSKYPLADSYQDRSIVSCVFDDVSDLGYDEAFSLGYINRNDSISEKYFDYERFGRDLVDNEEAYLELDDGKCVCYSL